MTVRKRLGTSIYADMLLMAFGLLPGYEYENLTIGKRREKFLRESNWLKVNKKSKIENYDSASKEELESVLKSLRNVERHWMKQIANEFTEQVKLKDKDGDEIKDTLEKYIKLLKNNMEAVQDASGKIIDYVSKTPPPYNDEDVVPDVEHEEPEDDDIPEGVDESDDLSPEEDPNATEEQKDTRSGAKTQPSAPVSPPDPQPHGRIHIRPIWIGPIVNINWKNIKKTSLPAVAVAIVAVLLLRGFPSSTPSTGDTFFIESFTVVTGDVIMSPNAYFSLITVANHSVGGVQTADITIKGENGATVAKTVSVDFDLPNNNSTHDTPDNSGPGHNIFPDSNSGPGHSIQLDDFVPEFTVSQKIRITGDTEWHNYVDAKVGDELEIQFEYRNTSENEHVNVAVRDILPTNLEYIPGSTTIYTTQAPAGLKKEDGIAGNGIYIGTYGSNSNAWVRFRVRVVDVNLADGVTGLVNWSQAGVNDVTLQDYATVRVTK